MFISLNHITLDARTADQSCPLHDYVDSFFLQDLIEPSQKYCCCVAKLRTNLKINKNIEHLSEPTDLNLFIKKTSEQGLICSR